MRSVVTLEPKGPPFFDPRDDVREASPARRYGITVRPLTYDPPLSDTDNGLDYVVGSPADGVQQSGPPRKLVNLQGVPAAFPSS